MLKYAKVIDDKTKLCIVGIGTDIKEYQSMGLVEMEVEQAYNNCWYVKGYAPAKPQEIINQERIAELEEYLKSTDWYAIRFADTGEEMPADIKKARQEVRDEISRLRSGE